MATILVVDDQCGVRQVLIKLLGRQGHRLLEAADGAEALAQVRTAHPQLVISDILMPTMDGAEFVRRLRADPAVARTPVIFYTAGYHHREAQALARGVGVRHVLFKPCPADVLFQTVNQALDPTPRPEPAAEAKPVNGRSPRLLAEQLAEKVAELEAVNARLSALTNLSRQLALEYDPQRLVHSYCAAARDLLVARHAAIALLADDGTHFRHFVIGGLDPGTASQLAPPSPFIGLLEPLLTQRLPVRVPDLTADRRAEQLIPPHPRHGAFLGVPIASSSGLHGVLYAIDKLGGGEFHDHDEQLAVTLATQLGVGLRSAQQYRALECRSAELEREVVERRHAEEALRESKERLQQIMANSSQVFWMAGAAADQLLYISPSYEQVWGRTCKSLYADPLSWLDAVHPNDRAAARAFLDGHNLGKRLTQEYRIVRPDGTVRLIRDHSFPILDRDGRCYREVGFAEDITEQRLLEEQYRQAQKMEAVGRLAGGVAHDFNNLLTIINGYSQLLLERLPRTDLSYEPIEQIRRAGDRATALTSQLLAFSRKQVFVPSILDVNALILDMEKMLLRVIGEDIDLRVRPGPELWPVKADQGQLEQVILNLVVNSRDAMPRGGKLTIETRNVELDENYHRTHTEVWPGSYMLLAVSDNGCGMSAETIRHIFEPFYTTKGPGKGTGLGLATVHGIVKQSGGHVAVYSEIDRGTTFKIYLPRNREVGRPSKSKPGVSRPRRGAETILLVEDEAPVRALARLILQEYGYTVLEAADGDQAQSVCGQYELPIHLLVTDVVTPQVSGRQLAERLLAQRPGMKLLYISGYADDAIVHHGVLDQSVAFLQKPFTPEALARAVREVLDQ